MVVCNFMFREIMFMLLSVEKQYVRFMGV